MSTDQTLQNISCLKTLALNILKNGSPDIIAKGVEVPELDPCSRCKEELFLYKLKKPFIALICSHIFHRSCLEDYLKDLSQCPICAIEIEPLLINAVIPMETSPLMSTQNRETISSESIALRASNPTASKISIYPAYADQIQSGKPKPKKRLHEEDGKKEPPSLKKLIRELKDDNFTQSLSFTSHFSEDSYTYLYQQIIKAEADNDIASQKLLNCYFKFGKKISERLDYYKNEKKYRDRMAQNKVDKEVKEQLPKEVSNTTRWKQTERARKIYDLFFEIGVDKMQRVKSYSALTISKLSWDNIDYIIDNIKS